jgi:hypothetical protein
MTTLPKLKHYRRIRMYYNRTLSDRFASLIDQGGELRWLYDFVKRQPELDFLVGKNNSKQWISVYRGLSRLLTVEGSLKTEHRKVTAAQAYKDLLPEFYSENIFVEDCSSALNELIETVSKTAKFDQYYKRKDLQTGKEGYYQNILSRNFGICGSADDSFVIIDKEAVVGYRDRQEKDEMFGPVQANYRDLLKALSEKDAKRYGRNLAKKHIGNELDFLALDRDGNILLIEYKHGTNTSGIYLSPFQIGMYYDLFNQLDRDELNASIFEMLEQKQALGLINPEWPTPSTLRDIVPVLMISEYNKGSGKDKFAEVMDFTRSIRGPEFLEKIKTYNYTKMEGISTW